MLEHEERRLKVFIDTSALLPAFARVLSAAAAPSPAFLADPQASRVTFEKCIFEAYMAFRGVGGKKPDEGRSDWAPRHLRGDVSGVILERLTSTVHGGDRGLALFWINNILGQERRDELERYVRDRQQWAAHEERLEQLRESRALYEALCGEFRNFLTVHGIDVLRYGHVFGEQPHPSVVGIDDLHPNYIAGIDRFVRETIIPAEDLEMVVAAERVGAEIFVTNDDRLARCAWSLGLNHRLSAASFCGSDDETYREKVRQCIEGDKFAEWL